MTGHARAPPLRCGALRRRLDEERARLLADRERLLPQLQRAGDVPEDTREQLRALGYAGEY